MKEEKSLKIKAIVLWTILIGFGIFAYFYVTSMDKQREENRVDTVGIISETYSLGGDHYVKVQFKAKGKTFVAQSEYLPHIDTASVGDSCEVAYDSTNPENNEILFNNNKHIKLKEN